MSDLDYPEYLELLSAYLDDQLSASDRKKVRELLANNPQVREEYEQMLSLQEKMSQLPIPPSVITPEQMSSRVFEQIKHQQNQRHKWLWGGGAIAVVSVATLSNLLPQRSLMPQWAQLQETPSDSESLVLAINQASQVYLHSPNPSGAAQLRITLNQPIVAIPK